MNWEWLPPLERDVAAPHDIAPCGEYSNVVGRVCQENILKPIKVRWPNLSCWGSHSIPWIQLARHALALSTPSQHIQPEPSIACLTWHIITVEIFVYFVQVPQSALQPTAKSSQLPLQLSQPESLIKTRCFHLGQLWKKSLPECGPLAAKPCCWRLYHVWQSWHSHRDQRGSPPTAHPPPSYFNPNVLLNPARSIKVAWENTAQLHPWLRGSTWKKAAPEAQQVVIKKPTQHDII